MIHMTWPDTTPSDLAEDVAELCVGLLGGLQLLGHLAAHVCVEFLHTVVVAEHCTA